MTTTEAFDTWWTESPENFCKAPLGSPECEMHRRTWKAATERAAKLCDKFSMTQNMLLMAGEMKAGELRTCKAVLGGVAAAIRNRDGGTQG